MGSGDQLLGGSYASQGLEVTANAIGADLGFAIFYIKLQSSLSLPKAAKCAPSRLRPFSGGFEMIPHFTLPFYKRLV